MLKPIGKEKGVRYATATNMVNKQGIEEMILES